MAAKLKIQDQNGKLVFDSSVHKVMSHLLTKRWAYTLTPTGTSNTLRITDPRITAKGTFAYMEFVSMPSGLLIYRSTDLIVTKYYEGYLDIILPSESTYNTNAVITYDVKVFNR